MPEPTVSTACSACQTAVAIPQSWLGKRRPCPHCHSWVTFAAAAAEGAADTPATLLGAIPPGAGAGGGAGGGVDPYGNTLISHPGLPANAGDSGAPLTFADRLKQAAAETSLGGAAPRRPTGAVRERSPAADTPRAVPAAGGGMHAGRDGEGGDAARRGVDDAWETDGSADGWSGPPRDRGRRALREARHDGRPDRSRQGSSVLGMLGLGAALVSVLLCGLVCVGVVGLTQSAAAGGGQPNEVWAVLLVGSMLLAPVMNLIGAVLSGIAVAQSGDRKALAIVGLIVNLVFLLGFAGLVCVGMLQS